MQDERFKIFWMPQSDLEKTINWTRLEGWNPGLNDAKLFYKADPDGFFGGRLGDDIVAMGSAVRYNKNFAFCGLYIVRPEHRGKGYGMQLTQERLKHCKGRNIGIDGVLENVHLYENIGYKKYYENARYKFKAISVSLPHPNIYAIDKIPFRCLKVYDWQCFPASRDAFLQSWINDRNAVSFGWVDDGKLKGYVVCRECFNGYRIGPLFADNVIIAEHLLLACEQNLNGKSIFIDIPDVNKKAERLISDFKMEQVWACARMYTKELPSLKYDKIFGTTSLELG